MTFASHRCWTVFVKKAVFLSVDAWRKRYGRSIRHAAVTSGGGAIIQHVRQGMDPYPLQGWRKVDIDGVQLLEGPSGERCASTAEAFDTDLANRSHEADDKDLRGHLTMIQKYLNQCCSEQSVLHSDEPLPDGKTEGSDEEGRSKEIRQVVTTSPLEDWLWRGDDA